MDGPATPRAPRALRAILGALAVTLAMAPGYAAGATAPLGGPDAPPDAAPAVSLPAPAAPAPVVPLVPAAPDAPAAAPSSAPAAPATQPPTGAFSADRVAAERAAAAARGRAVTRIGDGIDRRLGTASTLLARWASTSARSVERTGGSTGGGLVPSAVLALLLLFVSGVTAGVALLPRHGDGSAPAAARPAAAIFVEHHRLELAGVATSCLLLALLVFVGF